MRPDSRVRNRLAMMTTLGITLAICATALGWSGAAAGIVAGVPVALLNYWLGARGIELARHAPGAKGITILWRRSMCRLGINVLALLAASYGGVQFLLGVFAGVLVELMTYYFDVVRLVTKGGGEA